MGALYCCAQIRAKGLDGVLATHPKTVSYYLRKDIAAIYRDFVGQYDVSTGFTLVYLCLDSTGVLVAHPLLAPCISLSRHLV